MRDRAAEILNIFLGFERGRMAWIPLDIWKHALQGISSLTVHATRKSSDLLGGCLYAFLVIQAFAVATAETVLLLTLPVLKELQPFSDTIAECGYLESARMIFRFFFLAIQGAHDIQE